MGIRSHRRLRRGARRAWGTAAVAILVTACTGGSDSIDVPGAATTTPPTSSTTATTVAATTTTSTSSSTTTTTTTTTVPETTAPPATEAPASTVPPTSPPNYLRVGDEGDEVAIMQLQLSALGFLNPGYSEGVFDRATADALIDFQGHYGLGADGVYGPITEQALTAAAASVNPEG